MSVQFNAQPLLAVDADSALPEWLQQWQQVGREAFANQPWPTRKTEHWKYTPLKSLTQIDWQPANRHVGVSEAGVQFEQWNECKLSFVNGQLQDGYQLPDGVELVRLSQCDAQAGEQYINLLKQTQTGFEFDAFNQAVAAEGYWFKVAANAVIKQPIHLDFVSTGTDAVAASQVVIDVAQGAQATFAETFSATDDSRLFVNANAALRVADNAQLSHYHLLLEEGDVRHIGRVTGVLGRASRLNSFHMAVGGVLKRKDITIAHRGEGAELSLNGVYLPKGNEVIDYHTTLEHEVPNCHSEEIFRGILGDQAKAVFNGRIHIHKDAQKSIAEMNNRNLLLSDDAEIDTKPELEIYADDVRCAHGATIAQLDESLLFYFQARGISRSEAEVMLSFGFINELLDGLNDEPVQLLLRPMLAILFAKKQAELARHLL